MPLLDTREAAAYLGITVGTLASAISRGRGPLARKALPIPSRPFHFSRLYAKRDLIRWQKAKRQGGNTKAAPGAKRVR